MVLFRRFRSQFIFISLTLFIVVFLIYVIRQKNNEIYVLRDSIEHFQYEVRLLGKLIAHCQNTTGPLPSANTTIFIITPTYTRLEQKAELTRLCHTFSLLQNVIWIVVEDSEEVTPLVDDFLKRSCAVPFVHLNAVTPPEWKLAPKDPNWRKPRGVVQRNKGIEYLRESGYKRGVVYFADDDNTYDLALFKEMRDIKTVGVWPVGLVGGMLVEAPVVEDGVVVGFNSVWKPTRPFPIDMAGFAINLKLLLDKFDAWFEYEAPRGYLESTLLRQIVERSELEPKADGCTKVYVWHTQTKKTNIKERKNNRRTEV